MGDEGGTEHPEGGEHEEGGWFHEAMESQWHTVPHNIQRAAEDVWAPAVEGPWMPEWSQHVAENPDAGFFNRYFPQEESLEHLREHNHEISEMNEEGIGPESPGLGQGDAPEIEIVPENAPAPAAPEPIAAEPAPAPAPVAEPDLPTPYTDDMSQMVEDMRMNGGLSETPATAAAEPELATPYTDDMSQMVEDLQRARDTESAASSGTEAASSATESVTEGAGAESSALEELAEGAGGAEAGLGAMEIAGRVMGGAGAVGGIIEGAEGINELIHGDYEHGTLDLAAGGLGTAAGVAAMMGAACPPLAIAAAAAGMIAAGDHYTEQAGWWGQGEDGKNRTAFGWVGDETSAAYDAAGGGILGAGAATATAIGTGAVALGGDLVGGFDSLGAGSGMFGTTTGADGKTRNMGAFEAMDNLATSAGHGVDNLLGIDQDSTAGRVVSGVTEGIIDVAEAPLALAADIGGAVVSGISAIASW
jgi:hypothetical protein